MLVWFQDEVTDTPLLHIGRLSMLPQRSKHASAPPKTLFSKANHVRSLLLGSLQCHSSMPASCEGKGSAGPRDCLYLTPYTLAQRGRQQRLILISFSQGYKMQSVAQIVTALDF
jgi:hypothetical protein